ncbi:MAG: hypothetical protein ACXACB_00045 [Promethearchaeota archaeon]
MKHYRNLEYLFTLILLLATIISTIAAYIFWYSFTFFVGSYLFIHWLGLIATIFIVVSVPIYYILKRVKPQNLKILLKIHVLGNLFAFLVISIHFGQNFGRLAGYLQRLDEGFVLYLFLILMVTTGILERYQISGKLLRYIKVVHKYSVVVLFLIIFIHVLEGFNILLF